MIKKILKFIYHKYDDSYYCIYKIFGIKIITKPLRLQLQNIHKRIDMFEENMRDFINTNSQSVAGNINENSWNVADNLKKEIDRMGSMLKVLYIHQTSLASKLSTKADVSNYSMQKAIFAFNTIENNLNKYQGIDELYNEYRKLQTKYSILQDTYRYKNKKKIFYLQTPEHGNVGDHAIAYASKKLLNDLFPDRVIIDYTYNDLLSLLYDIKKIIEEDDIVCLIGGGNLGNLYINEEDLRRSVIQEFKNNKIIIFPQSVYFTNDSEGEKELQKSQTIYNNHNFLTIFIRDEKSFKLAKHYFYNNEVVLMPDIVLYLEDYDYTKNDVGGRNDVLFLLRSDKEKVVTDENINKIKSYLETNNIKYNFSDTEIYRDIEIYERDIVVESILNKISKYKLVITDRFHGVVFSVITKTPCIVFDSFDHKIKYGVRWFKDLDFIYYAESNYNKIDTIIDYYFNSGYKAIFNISFKKMILDTFLKSWNKVTIKTRQSNKIFHISIDDSMDIFKDITDNQNVYATIFENNILRYFKKLNDKYNVCVSLYVFYSYNNFKLSDMTDKFQKDFKSNFHWLKLGFHSLDANIDYSISSKEQIVNDYNLIIEEIIRITGGLESIDSVVRLHCYKANLENSIAIKNIHHGISGFLSADDDRDSYYLKKNENIFLNDQYIYKDVKNDILFFKTNVRIENIVNINEELKRINTNKNLIIFTHEVYMNEKEVQDNIEILCQYATENNYNFAFPMNITHQFSDIKNEYIKKFVDLYIPVTTCNLRCTYCYVTQCNRYNEKLPDLKYSQKHIRQALSKQRLGGTCLINMCADGETLLHTYIIDLIKELLLEGHFIWIVTNGTLSERFDSILAFPKNLLVRLGFKFSFHYLELLRLSKMDDFIKNVDKVKKVGCSFSIEITPHDELIDKIEEIKNFCYKEFGALCHITVARDDTDEKKPILTKLPYEKYKETWQAFDSDLFNFKLSTWGIKRKEFCYAGVYSFVLNIGNGVLRQCYSTQYEQNIFDDNTKEIELIPIENKCPESHCYNAHVFLTLGNIPSIDTPYYYEMRNRVCKDGRQWLNPYMKEFLSHKLCEQNKDV